MPNKTYFEEKRISITYEGNRELYWIAVGEKKFPFPARGFDEFYQPHVNENVQELMMRLDAYHAGIGHVITPSDLELIAKGLKITGDAETKELAAFKKTLNAPAGI